jgi:tRNA threonylcarbamoyladenosine biosynthesis protein TsaB
MKAPSLSTPVLAIDASDAASLVLALPNRPWRGVRIDEGRGRASELLDALNGVLREEGVGVQDIGAMVLCSGPGSFTGLRIAAGLVQGMARGLQKTVAVVSAFEAYALAWLLGSSDRGEPETGMGLQRDSLSVFINARLGEFYKARLRFNPLLYQFEFVGEPEIAQQKAVNEVSGLAEGTASIEPEAILVEPSPLRYCTPFGRGDASRSDSTQPPVEALQSLSYWSLVAAALSNDPQRFGPVVKAQPLYVRDKVAMTREERLNAPAMGLQPLHPADLASVMVIENQAYEVPWTSGNFRDAFSSGYQLMKLVDQGVMIGYLVCMRVLDECHLLNFTIAPSRQRRGAGQFMLDQWIKMLLAEKVNIIMLEVRPSNLAALRLYERNGFQRVGLRKDYYPTRQGEAVREDAVLMNRSLADKGRS